MLTGRYSQAEVDCGEAERPARPIRELVFGPTGRFSVTWEPFDRPATQLAVIEGMPAMETTTQ